MPPLTPNELRTRRRVESLIRLMAPAFDVVLAVGDRVSRIVERDDPDYYPPRVGRRTGDALPGEPDGAAAPSGPPPGGPTHTPPPPEPLHT